MHPPSEIPCNQPIGTRSAISFVAECWHHHGVVAMLGALMVVLLLLGACAPISELPASAPQTQARPLPPPLPPPPPPPPPAEMRMAMPVSPPATWPGVDRFPGTDATGVLSVSEHPVSTFSVDVDAASYAVVRRILTGGRLPPREAVRVEEMVNYFPYTYPTPEDRRQPFYVTTTVVPSPWSTDNQLLHIGIRAYDIARAERPRAHVVLLIDTSGSMAPSDRLPLLQQGFRLFAEQLRDDDHVAIVTYAGQAEVALEPTPGREKHKIIEAIDRLRATGSTAGGEGLQRAYALAERHFDQQAVNRVILATDGDFNVGITDPRELERFIAAKRKSGIYLSIFGVGLGNLNDALMQRLAQAGNGNAAYIDLLLEARKAMSQEFASTLFPIADDVKVQVEFNPARVAEYRLIGYETRMLRREEFTDDKVDAADVLASLDTAPVEQRFAIAVAAFAQRLRGESAIDSFSYDDIAKLANATRGADPEGYRAEFVRLVRMAETLSAVGQRCERSPRDGYNLSRSGSDRFSPPFPASRGDDAANWVASGGGPSDRRS